MRVDWTYPDVLRLRKLRAEGVLIKLIAHQMQRTYAATLKKCSLLKIKAP